MKLIIPAILLAAFLTGCASMRAPIVAPVNTGYQVQINQQFDNLPNYTRLYFQQGNRVAENALDRWTTYCRLHVYNPDRKADYLASVKPGSFVVANVGMRRESSRYSHAESGFYASVGIGLSNYRSASGLNREREGPPSFYLYRVDMKLAAPGQPDVQRLICSRKWSTRGSYFPTLDEIRNALGNIIEIIPPSGSTGT